MKSEFLIKAKDNLNAAQMCFENGFYDSCANRAYYAVFHAAIAALADRGIKRDKIDHKSLSSPSEILSYGYAECQKSG